MRSIDGTLFDYGHTLAYLPRIERTHDVAAKNIRRLVSNLGIQANDTRIKELINEYAQGPREVVSIREEFSQILVTLGVDNFNEADLLESIRVHGRPYIQNARIRRGAKELLQLLKNRGIKTGIVANSPGAYLIDPVLERERMRNLFDAAVVSADVGVRKPDPRIFQLALKKLGLRPQHVIMIGDNPRNDIQGAHNVGMHTVRFLRGPNRTKPDLVKPDYKIRNFSTLASIVVE